MTKTTETLDRICGKLEIYQSKSGYRFGLESVLLAWFVRPGAESMVELGCGSGVISILMVHFKRVQKAVGVEIQADLAERAKRSAAHNRLSNRIDILQANLKDLTGILPAGVYEVVVANPPYRLANTGNVSQEPEKALGKHEILCNLADVVSSATRLLKPRGLFNVVFPPQRLSELLRLCQDHGLCPSRLRMVHGRQELTAKNCLLEAVRSGKGTLTVEAPLIVYDLQGSYTEEVKAMLYL